MGRFYPLYARRSDGKLEVIIKGKRRERNEPTSDQLDQKPDKHGISDFYREVSSEEMKSLDWRRKLGGMLARELDWKEKAGGDHGYMLVTFPENYRLYEHVKKTEKDGKTEVKNKTHAGGGNDRQDAYLYGHPTGRKKRFRSPAEFFPHLLWLVTDESGDSDNCGCKVCSPEDLEAAIPGAKAKTERPVRQEPEIRSVTNPATLVPRQSSGEGLKAKQETAVPVKRPQTALTPTLLPKPKTADQELDRQYYTFMYRPGELVWFKKGVAWALGVVLRRWIMSTQDHNNQYYYAVQPLSYPGHNAPTVTKSSDFDFRPWLAWSVPKFTHNNLNHLPMPPHYDTADWQGMAQNRYGHGEMEVDASILAAKAVDATYTPFAVRRTSEPEPTVTETYYDGIFLGAEKIEVGDPVRLHVGSGTDIMILHAVVERTRASATKQTSTYLTGDVYSLATVTHRPGDNNPNVSTRNSRNGDNGYLPARMLEDLRMRNERSIAVKGTANYWKLVASQTKLGLDEIKGRWYEASILLPILQPAQYEAFARKGEVGEASLWMNARGDCINTNRPQNAPKLPKQNIRKDTRKQAFGQAVPPNTEITDGVEPPLPDNVDPALAGAGASSDEIMEIDPRFETAGGGDNANAVEGQHGGLDDFMNLDGMDDPSQMPGFGQEYGSQQGPPGAYY